MRRGSEILAAYQQRVQDEKLAQHVMSSCALCDWETEGTLLETSTKHAQHRAKKHPELVPKRRAKHVTTLRTPMNGKTLDQNIDNARAEGAATWDGAAA